jgi:hypothetical protein
VKHFWDYLNLFLIDLLVGRLSGQRRWHLRRLVEINRDLQELRELRDATQTRINILKERYV